MSLNPILSKLKYNIKAIRDYIYHLGDSHGIIGPETIYDGNYYKKRREDPWRSDAQVVSQVLDEEFEPESVIDFGCAIGAHLEWFHEKGIEVRGVEGNPEAFKHAVVPESHLEEYDLREPYQSSRDWDLVLCFEVAEHLPEKFADVLVDTLASSGETVVMTAASPGQGGTHHVNEQPPEYWHRKFETRGMMYDMETVEMLRDQITVEESEWIPRNIMVFRSTTQSSD